MDAPRGSADFEESDELQRLRRRAYGPNSDIAGDAAAQARLSELEAAQRREQAPVVDAAAALRAPVSDRVPGPQPLEGSHAAATSVPQPVNGASAAHEPDGGQATEADPAGAAIADSPPIDGALSAPWWRRRRLLPWVIVAVAVLVAAIGIVVFVVDESNQPEPVAQLTPQGRPGNASIPVDDGVPVRYDLTVADFVSYGSYGPLQIWSTTKLENRRCIAVVVENHISVFECTAPSVDTIADYNIDPNMIPPAPSGELTPYVRFVLRDDVVDVYRPKEEGEFYGSTPRESRPPHQTTVTADYRFENSLADSVGAAAELSAIGAHAIGFIDEAVLGQTRPVLTFNRGSGLELAPASVAMGSEYTIELVFRFDRLDGYAKIVDFTNATEDRGLYSFDGRMAFWPITTGFGAAVEADSYAQVVLTRDATDNVVAYVNGARQLSFHDTGDMAVIDANDTLRLFSDDTATANEDSGGAVSRIRLYDGPLSAGDVAALAAELLITAPTLADVEPFLREEAAADRFSGAVLLTRNGEVLFSQAVGPADRDRAIPNTLQTRFRIGSMNKMITAVAILQLVEAGKIDLTAYVGDYLTDYPNTELATTVTIHHLLTHTGGTGDIFGPTFDAHRDELRTHHDYVVLYGPRGPEFDPGTRWAYSNYGFVLLGAIIEAVTGQTYYDYVDDRIYQPAEMTATGSLPETEAVPDRSIGYTAPTPGGEWSPNTDTLPYRGTAAGGGYSTVEDLTRFAQALLNHRLLSPDSTDLLFTAKVDSGPGTGYAYGFEDQRDADGSGPVGHSGGAPGINGDLRIYPNSGDVVAVLANLNPPAAQRISSYLHPRLPPP